MNAPALIPAARDATRCPYEWLARVLTNFALAEQSLGRLCRSLDLEITNGSLSKLSELRRKLAAAGDRRCTALDNRVSRWAGNRPIRHLLAHATLHCSRDPAGREIVVTRHLPRDRSDVTPDRMWLPDEREEILRQAANDGRSITDLVRNILSDTRVLDLLRSA